ncbi:MAG TPA: hypothetical protein VN223_05665, partial [Candidatus Elarobacter sp.]|nr:hypothetical protein [Candidatus Elarobacter sp.]
VAQISTSANSTRAQTSPAIPEEARKHFVMGMTLFKDAKTANDFAAVESEFTQAAELVPQWPEARYNLALAKEAAGDYPGAIADLKLYQKFKLSDTEARTVQDKIYVLEAKAGVAAKKQAEEQRATAAATATEEQKQRHYQNKIGFLAGQWKVSQTYSCTRCGDWNGRVWYRTDVVTIKGDTVFVSQPDGEIDAKGIITGDDYQSIKWSAVARESDRRPGQAYPDFAIEVAIEKSSARISWKAPAAVWGQEWTWAQFSTFLLTK